MKKLMLRNLQTYPEPHDQRSSLRFNKDDIIIQTVDLPTFKWIQSSSVIFFYLFIFLRWSFALAAHDGVQWCNLSSQFQVILLPQPTELLGLQVPATMPG